MNEKVHCAVSEGEKWKHKDAELAEMLHRASLVSLHTKLFRLSWMPCVQVYPLQMWETEAGSGVSLALAVWPPQGVEHFPTQPCDICVKALGEQNDFDA